MEQIELNMLTLEKCLVCGSNQFEPFLVCKDYTVSKKNFNIVSCKACGFKFTNPRPDNSILGDYYKAEEYVSHTNTKKGIVKITIETKSNDILQCNFLNALGQLVQSYTIDSIRKTLDITEIPEGLYFITSTDEETLIVKKFIKTGN